MSNVKEDIEYLIKLVNKDLLIKEKRDILHRNPVKIMEIDEKILILEDELNEKKELLKKMEKEERYLDSVIKSENDKIQTKKIEENRRNK